MMKSLGGCAAISIDPCIAVAAVFDSVAIMAKVVAVSTIHDAAVARVATELRDIVGRLSEGRPVDTLRALVLLPPRHIGRH